MHPEPDPPAPLRLWRTLAAYIEAAYALFGAPGEIAQQVWLNRHQHKLCAGWLQGLEALLRRLLHLDALNLSPSAAAQRVETKRRPRLAMRVWCGAAFDMERPESWRARFVLIAPQDHRRARRMKASAPLIQVRASAPLALRLEAIVRAYNNREAEAQRLADLLQRRAEQGRACDPAAPIAKARCARAYPAFNVLRDLIHEAGALIALECRSIRAADTS